jgi:hypothetical protein
VVFAASRPEGTVLARASAFAAPTILARDPELVPEGPTRVTLENGALSFELGGVRRALGLDGKLRSVP